MQIYEDIEALYPEIINREIRKDPYFHFGYKTWDDIALDIKEHLYSKSHLYNKSYPLYTWMKSVTKNQIINKKRDAITQNKITNKVIGPHDWKTYQFIAELNNDPLPQNNSECLEDISEVIKLVWSRLTLKTKKVCVMAFKHKMSSRDIDRKTGMCYRTAWYKIKNVKAEVLREFARRNIHIRQ